MELKIRVNARGEHWNSGACINVPKPMEYAHASYAFNAGLKTKPMEYAHANYAFNAGLKTEPTKTHKVHEMHVHNGTRLNADIRKGC